ncbi:MAG: hypothetical protein NZ518_05250 [Dehalococcoidia bacterium]|nr:hypothetical protein [Dehalococcoidia bacterium]
MARQEHPRTAPGVDRDVRVPVLTVVTAALLILAASMVIVVTLRPGLPRGVTPPTTTPSRAAAVIPTTLAPAALVIA